MFKYYFSSPENTKDVGKITISLFPDIIVWICLPCFLYFLPYSSVINGTNKVLITRRPFRFQYGKYSMDDKGSRGSSFVLTTLNIFCKYPKFTIHELQVMFSGATSIKRFILCFINLLWCCSNTFWSFGLKGLSETLRQTKLKFGVWLSSPVSVTNPHLSLTVFPGLMFEILCIAKNMCRISFKFESQSIPCFELESGPYSELVFGSQT